MDLNSTFLTEWNSEFPLDRWWRTKYNIPFNSETHRSISPQDMLLDFMEDSFYKKVLKQLSEESDEENLYIPGEKSFLKPQKASEEEFDILDLNLINF